MAATLEFIHISRWWLRIGRWITLGVALVGFGKVVQRASVVDGRIVVARVVHATLSADHRVSDGMRGARFLTELDRLFQEPETLA